MDVIKLVSSLELALDAPRREVRISYRRETPDAEECGPFVVPGMNSRLSISGLPMLRDLVKRSPEIFCVIKFPGILVY